MVWYGKKNDCHKMRAPPRKEMEGHSPAKGNEQNEPVTEERSTGRHSMKEVTERVSLSGAWGGGRYLLSWAPSWRSSVNLAEAVPGSCQN